MAGHQDLTSPPRGYPLAHPVMLWAGRDLAWRLAVRDWLAANALPTV